MPAISLVICLYQQRDLLARLLAESAGCYDDLVVVHDGPDTTQVRELVEQYGGRFFEREREYQQEPHWPFSWGAARHDWILRLDADEYPSEEMKAWLRNFRSAPEPAADVSGFTCIWPVWKVDRAITRYWPAGRNFLFDRRKVRFFGMVEQTPIADGHYEALPMVLRHEHPNRKAYGLRNLLIRPQARQWRRCIARSLLGQPSSLACWRWEDRAWPADWEQIRQRPLQTAVRRLVLGTLRTLRDQWRVEKKVLPTAALGGPLHHALICLEYRSMRRAELKQGTSAKLP